MGITAKELAEKLNLSAAAVSMALHNKPGVSTQTRQLVYDTALKYGFDFSKISEKKQVDGSIYLVIYQKHGTVVADTPFFSKVIYKDLESEVERSQLKRAISKLGERERTIIMLRFGLNNPDDMEMTQKEVADYLGISQSYISRLEKKIMKRLKKEMAS